MSGVEAMCYKSLPKHELAVGGPVSDAETFEDVTRAIEIVDELLCDTLPGAMAQVEQAFSVVQMVKSVLQEVSRKHGGDDTDGQSDIARDAMQALGYTEPNSPTPSVEEWIATWQNCSARTAIHREDIVEGARNREGNENSPPRTPRSGYSSLATPESGSTRKASTASSPYAEAAKSHSRPRSVEEKALPGKQYGQEGAMRSRSSKKLSPDTDTIKVNLLRTPSPVYGKTRPLSDFMRTNSVSPGSGKNSGGKAQLLEKKPRTPVMQDVTPGKLKAASPARDEPAAMAPIHPGDGMDETQHIHNDIETELEVAGWLCDQHGKAHARLKQHIASAYAGEPMTCEKQMNLERQAALSYCSNVVGGAEKIKEVSPETLKKLQRTSPPPINTRPRCSGCGSKEHIPLQCPATAMGVTVGDLLANVA